MTPEQVAEEIATRIIIMDHPTLGGKYNDPWEMFKYVRNTAYAIALEYTNGKEKD